MFDLKSVLCFPESYQISTLIQREITLLPKKMMRVPIEYILFSSDYSESRERIWLISGKLNSIEFSFFLEMERKVIEGFLFFDWEMRKEKSPYKIKEKSAYSFYRKRESFRSPRSWNPHSIFHMKNKESILTFLSRKKPRSFPFFYWSLFFSYKS